MSKDRRVTSRIFFEMPAELTVDDKNYYVRQIADLSVGGCLLEIRENFPVGIECSVKIMIEGTHQGLVVNAIGEIIRNDSNTVSVKFTLVDDGDHSHLKNIIKYSLPILKYNPEIRSKFS